MYCNTYATKEFCIILGLRGLTFEFFNNGIGGLDECLLLVIPLMYCFIARILSVLLPCSSMGINYLGNKLFTFCYKLSTKTSFKKEFNLHCSLLRICPRFWEFGTERERENAYGSYMLGRSHMLCLRLWM